jgi:XRE family transcriptional regulator, fatty acid utilization regulator
MIHKGLNNKIIFGLKVRQLRNERSLSFAELAEKANMSVSYLNEIEKGKKFPKEEKIKALAEALQTTPQYLVSEEMPLSLAPIETLLQSNFLSELPLDLFGIDLSKVVEIIANAPMRVGAFISTLVELSRSYALREENFYFAALRSYLELNNNYFEEIEETVKQFVKQHKIPTGYAVPADYLGSVLEKKFGYKIIDNGLAQYPDLKHIRAVFVPKSKELLLSSNLNELQKSFQYGKELGFNALALKERAYTSSLLQVKTFDEALNHFKAGYFSAALLMNREAFTKDIDTFLTLERWDNGAFLIKLMDKYQATPEMLFQRMTNVLPRFFGLSKIFFLRFIHNLETDKFDINKEMHLHRRHQPHGNGLDEHYCRRWISITLLQDFQNSKNTEGVMIGAQRSNFYRTNDEYLCLTMVHPDGKRNVSVTLGILIDTDTVRKIKFLNDATITTREVSITCERCGVINCAERAVEPSVIQKKEQRQRVNEALKNILDN